MTRYSLRILFVALIAGCASGEVGGSDGDAAGDAAGGDDVSPLCGNGELDTNEECDPEIASGAGACPTSCTEDSDPCTTVTLLGASGNCTARCEPVSNGCANADGCCLDTQCNNNNDDDCPVVCGNDAVETGELCDGSCPTSCDDPDPCVTGQLNGTGCQRECTWQTIETCSNGDSCCPRNCTGTDDSDCTGAFGLVGHACNTDADCAGLCGTAAGYANPGGYCTAECMNNPFGCGSGNHCGAERDGVRFCRDDCSSNDDCRPGYECFDSDGDSIDECQPVASGAKGVGEACVTTDECSGDQSGFCAAEVSGSAPGGYCTRILCTEDNGVCPSGSHCGIFENGFGFCLSNCTGSCSPARNHYDCYDADDDDVDECWIAPSGPGAIGAACDGPTDCGGGAFHFCFSFWTDGYCAADCTPDTGLTTCAGGSHCVSFGTFSTCLKDCTVLGDCGRVAPYECSDTIDSDSVNECIDGTF